MYSRIARISMLAFLAMGVAGCKTLPGMAPGSFAPEPPTFGSDPNKKQFQSREAMLIHWLSQYGGTFTRTEGENMTLFVFAPNTAAGFPDINSLATSVFHMFDEACTAFDGEPGRISKDQALRTRIFDAGSNLVRNGKPLAWDAVCSTDATALASMMIIGAKNLKLETVAPDASDAGLAVGIMLNDR